MGSDRPGAAAIAGTYGMNFNNMPELRWKYGHCMALALLALLAVVCVGLHCLFRRNGWL